jgi:hypothetical protein
MIWSLYLIIHVYNYTPNLLAFLKGKRWV